MIEHRLGQAFEEIDYRIQNGTLEEVEAIWGTLAKLKDRLIAGVREMDFDLYLKLIEEEYGDPETRRKTSKEDWDCAIRHHDKPKV